MTFFRESRAMRGDDAPAAPGRTLAEIGMTRRVPSALALLFLAFALPLSSASAAGEAETSSIEGQVFDHSGAPVGEVPVRILMTRRVLRLGDLSLEDDVAEGPATRTDAGGFFRIRWAPDPVYDYFYLRFYDAESFDAVRYALPVDEDITLRVRSGRPVIVNRQLADASTWPELRREIDRVGGEDTPRGEILRALGMPDQVVTLEGGLVEWRYERAGVRYRLQEGRLVEVLRAAAPASAASPGGAP
jgi:hypothetical protein